jgi:aminoglycoside phosphotransferase family enzyme/predicted kinase
MRPPTEQAERELDQRAVFASMIQELVRPEAFARIEAAPVAPATAVQTHASAVLLTSQGAYKLKKPENLGFLDYSTPELRRHFCQLEVRLNTRRAPGIYLGVAPVIRLPDGCLRFTRIRQPDDVPMPGETVDGGRTVDFAVAMVRLPEEATFDSLVRTGQLTPELLAAAACYVDAFHDSARADAQVAHFGTPGVIRGNWEENFDQMRPYIGRTLTMPTYERIATYVHAFMARRAALFEERVRDGRIRDCHGDLRLQHIYRFGSPYDATSRLAILDCIEFNERFRCSDVASEIAFLAMELDIAGRADLARAFIQTYVSASGDDTLREVLPFYLCYRACVRGKVASFLLDQPEIPCAQRDVATRQAAAFFELAAQYASGPARPVLVMIGGVMGTGKTTTAASLHAALGWPVLSTDPMRKRLAGLDPAAPQDAAFERGIYSPAWTARTYCALQREADTLLRGGHAVILDASFMRQSDREAMRAIARKRGADALFVECTAPREVVLARLAARWARRTTGRGRDGGAAVSDASDGRPELFDQQRARWEPVAGGCATSDKYLVIDTSRSEVRCIEQLLDALDAPRLACWLNDCQRPA